MSGRVLLVDDEEVVLDTYAELMESYGFTTGRARSRADVLSALEAESWDVILLDERLSGSGGPSTAAAILAEIAAVQPHARTIVLTGYASEYLIRAAIAAGAWDYVEKRFEFVNLLLPIRVRHAVEAATQRRRAGMTPDELERTLRDTWRAALQEPDRHRKGALLEDSLELLFRRTPGFEEVVRNRRSSNEEFDLVVTNASTDPVLAKEGSFFLVECKNWSVRVDPKELTHLVDKLRGRRGRFKLGILVAVHGFTTGVETLLQRQANEDWLVLPLQGSDVTSWIDATDRVGWLRERVRRASLRE